MKSKRILPGVVALTFIALVAACVPVAASQTGGSQCKAADSVSTRINIFLSNLLVSTESGDVAMRDTVGIAGVQPRQVVLVADSRTCSGLASALDRLEGVNRPGRLVYAFSVGNTFVALDPTIKSGEWVPLLFYNNHFKFLWSVVVF